MFKKTLLLVLALFLLSAVSEAQQTSGKKVLIILNTFEDPDRASSVMLGRIVRLKTAGIEVRVIFERWAVLKFIDLHGLLSTPAWAKKIKDLAAEAGKPLPAGQSAARYYLLKTELSDTARTKEYLQKIKDAGIPYTLCSFSAKNLGVYEELKTAGEPMSPDLDKGMDITQFILEGYQVLVF